MSPTTLGTLQIFVIIFTLPGKRVVTLRCLVCPVIRLEVMEAKGLGEVVEARLVALRLVPVEDDPLLLE